MDGIDVVYWIFLVLLLIVVGMVLYRSVCDELYFHYKDYKGGFYFDKNYNTSNTISNLTPTSYMLLNVLDQVDCDVQKNIKSLLSEHNSDLALQAEYKKIVSEYTDADLNNWEDCNEDVIIDLVFATPKIKKYLSNVPLYRLGNVITSNKSTYYWVQILSKLLNCNPKKYILALSDHKKQFKEESGDRNKTRNRNKIVNEKIKAETVLTKDAINSAEFHKVSETLYVYRKEEFIKTLIHELIHCSKKDEWLYNVKFTLPVNNYSNLLLTEAATEALAQFINVMICSTDNHSFNYLWEKEITFGLYQTAKILYLSSISDISDFLSGKHMIIQDTAAIEYHMISTIFMIHFHEFYKAFTTQNTSQILKILNYINNKKYKEIINKFIYDFSIGYQINKNLYKTSRMSVTERLI